MCVELILFIFFAQAMDLGIPVIARNIPAHSTIIEDGNTGLLYNWPEVGFFVPIKAWYTWIQM